MKNSNYFPKKLKFTLILLMALTVSFLSKAQTISSVMPSYDTYDMDSDGIKEINHLTFLPFEDNNETIGPKNKLVLVLVEDRLLNSLSGGVYTKDNLLDRLEQYKDDLRAEGYLTRFIESDIYDGNQHQDGQTLLAIREFLKDINETWNLQGVVLVSSFPEAMLVRRWLWHHKGNVTIAGVDYKGDSKEDYLRIVPEIVAHRADLVLEDLDGNWEDIYEKGPINLESIEAIPISGTANNWPTDYMTFTSTRYNDRTASFQDFFWIRDDNYQRLTASPGTLRLRLRTTQRHPEISAGNRSQSNPISIPEILVSRINPKNVAVIPDRNYRDLNNKGFLDNHGNPQTIETTQDFDPKSFLKKDPIVERELMIHYFDRNHSYRVGGNPLNSPYVCRAKSQEQS